ncbi:uncharacterized protein NEMAJ01_1819 [Nematocida major]|uniref:uncharacterized protein n=1 Tax=Nematocida major TaxID=1912982 RepID=UPI002007DA5A|nr:uncharacterized protein NEMAJ01_1819 [Nematocida major]KAH9386923.1 hypothetical protein NEMAJ01_1819 [Nematocida major]
MEKSVGDTEAHFEDVKILSVISAEEISCTLPRFCNGDPHEMAASIYPLLDRVCVSFREKSGKVPKSVEEAVCVIIRTLIHEEVVQHCRRLIHALKERTVPKMCGTSVVESLHREISECIACVKKSSQKIEHLQEKKESLDRRVLPVIAIISHLNAMKEECARKTKAYRIQAREDAIAEKVYREENPGDFSENRLDTKASPRRKCAYDREKARVRACLEDLGERDCFLQLLLWHAKRILALYSARKKSLQEETEKAENFREKKVSSLSALNKDLCSRTYPHGSALWGIKIRRTISRKRFSNCEEDPQFLVLYEDLLSAQVTPEVKRILGGCRNLEEVHRIALEREKAVHLQTLQVFSRIYHEPSPVGFFSSQKAVLLESVSAGTSPRGKDLETFQKINSAEIPSSRRESLLGSGDVLFPCEGKCEETCSDSCFGREFFVNYLISEWAGRHLQEKTEFKCREVPGECGKPFEEPLEEDAPFWWASSAGRTSTLNFLVDLLGVFGRDDESDEETLGGVLEKMRDLMRKKYVEVSEYTEEFQGNVNVSLKTRVEVDFTEEYTLQIIPCMGRVDVLERVSGPDGSVWKEPVSDGNTLFNDFSRRRKLPQEFSSFSFRDSSEKGSEQELDVKCVRCVRGFEPRDKKTMNPQEKSRASPVPADESKNSEGSGYSGYLEDVKGENFSRKTDGNIPLQIFHGEGSNTWIQPPPLKRNLSTSVPSSPAKRNSLYSKATYLLLPLSLGVAFICSLYRLNRRIPWENEK